MRSKSIVRSEQKIESGFISFLIIYTGESINIIYINCFQNCIAQRTRRTLKIYNQKLEIKGNKGLVKLAGMKRFTACSKVFETEFNCLKFFVNFHYESRSIQNFAFERKSPLATYRKCPQRSVAIFRSSRILVSKTCRFKFILNQRM